MSKILVTGGGGFIGTRLTRMLLDAGHSVDVVDKMGYAFRPDFHMINPELLTPFAESDRSRFFPYSIQNFSVVEGLYDTVIILHAESHVDNSIKSGEIFFEDNVRGTVKFFEAIKHFDKKPRVILFSTDEVLGETFQPAVENHPFSPRNPYSASKAAQEMVALGYARTFSIPLVTTRCTNIYGPGQHPEKFIPKSILNLLSGNPITLYGVGAESRQWVYVDDICNGVLKILEKSEIFLGDIFHFSGESIFQNMQLAQTLCKMLGVDQHDFIKKVPNRLGHDLSYNLSREKSSLVLNWYPLVSMEEGLQRTVAFYRQSLDQSL